jgi:fumarylacetoacetase
MLQATLDPSAQSWVPSANEATTDFPVQNLPWGVFAADDGEDHIGIAIGDQILDLKKAVLAEAIPGLSPEAACAVCAPQLNQFMAMGHCVWQETRHAIWTFLEASASPREDLLVPQEGTVMRLPARIGDYTDFYAARNHATNVGRMFRPDGDPLLPNYLHLPVGYHGRASSIVISGTDIQRPMGQLKPEEGPPVFAACRLLDYELECAAFIGTPNAMGTRVSMSEAMDHIFGIVILNDWSARDVQKWEYQPLGPFNAKNFASTISPWIVTIDALTPFRSHGPQRMESDPAVLEYLQPVTDDALDVTCEVTLSSSTMRSDGLDPMHLSSSSLTELTWTVSQMLAHHTSTGCPMNAGDLIGTGTISGAQKSQRGCLLELTWRGTEPMDLPDGTQRKFLLDGDELTISAFCQGAGATRIGFGSCAGVIVPSR